MSAAKLKDVDDELWNISSVGVSDSDVDSNPPSSVQMSNQLSDRLDFGHVDGGKMAARKYEQDKRKFKSFESLEEGELSTDSEFEAPRKIQKTDNIDTSESTEIDNSIVTSESVETTEKDTGEDDGDITLQESETYGEEYNIVDDAEIDDEGNDEIAAGDSDDELDDDEIHAWLEEGIEKQGTKSQDQDEEGSYTEREKMVLKEKGRNPFEVLPEGWVAVTHNSGMPVYLHKQTRVCTLSKPYFLGPGSVRKHNIPISGIPCLHYRREKEKEQQMENTEQIQSDNSEPVQKNRQEKENGTQSVNGEANVVADPAVKENDGLFPAPEIQSLEKTQKETSIERGKPHLQRNKYEPEELLKYCEGLFEFKAITVKKFKSWKEKRKHLNELKSAARPSLPTDIKLITCPVQPVDKTKSNRANKKEFVLNPVGKTPLCILHEYVQHVMRVQPVYTFKELESAKTPYSATVKINELEYGTGVAASKRAAKLEAAKATLDILIPHLKVHQNDPQKKENFGDLSFFDEIGLEDPRVADLCNKAALHKPYQVLQECLKRNYGMGENKIQIDKTVLSNQKSEFSITVGKHKASVVCKNKREGKQMAAQAMLQLLHPHITSWGSIMRLYSEITMLGYKEKEEHPVTLLQNHKSHKEDNEILKKLKETMRNIQERREQFNSMGTLKIDYKVPQGSVKGIDL